MVTPFDIVAKIYTEKKVNWVYDLDDADIDVFMIQRILSMNITISNKVSFLSKYTRNPDKKQYVAMACVTIPTVAKTPYCPYLKRKTEVNNIYQPVLDKIQRLLGLTHNDIVDEAKYYIAEIEKDKEMWFRKLGMEKSVWRKHGLNFDGMRGGEQRDIKVGLDVFGI